MRVVGWFLGVVFEGVGMRLLISSFPQQEIRMEEDEGSSRVVEDGGIVVVVADGWGKSRM